MANSGPVYLDCRQLSGALALRRLESALKKVRGGPRMVILRTDESEVLELVQEWAEAGCARHSTSESFDSGILDAVIRIFLLPHDFDAHPFLAWRPLLTISDLGATPSL